jgi:hypothetical protein
MDFPTRGGSPRGAFYSSANNRIFWFVHFSDTHIGAWGNSDSDNLNWMVTTARSAIAPEFFVVTGDLTDSTGGNRFGHPDGPYQSEWDEYKAILANAGVNASFFYDLPGNHDAFNDQHFAYYLANSIQGRATGGTQASWIREFPFGKYHFLGVNTADNSGNPFSVSWPFGDNAGLDADELAFINSELDESGNSDADLTMIFGHHPVYRNAGESYTFLFYGQRPFISALDAHGASLYGYGHTHASGDLQFTGNAYTGYMINGGLRYVNGDALGRSSPFSYDVIAIDCNGVSSVSAAVGTWPVVLITAPVARLLSGTPNPYSYAVPASSANPIRALVFDAGPVSSVLFRVDAEETWHPMGRVEGNPRLHEGTWNASALAAGDHTITVQAAGTTTRTHAITVTVDPAEPTNEPPAAVDDAYLADQDTTLTIMAPGVLANDTDADGDALTSSLLTSPARGVVSLSADGAFTYAPNAGFFGQDSFTYAARDGETASAGATVSITIRSAVPPVLAAVSIDPAAVLGGNPSTGMATLDLPAPAGGAVVSLSSSAPSAQVPATVTVGAGQTTATFPIATSPVVADTQATISAIYNSVTQTAVLTVAAPVPALTTVSVQPATVLGGGSSTGYVSLDYPAPAGDADISLSSSDPSVQMPATMTVETGQTTATFPVTSSPVSNDIQVTISAAYNSVIRTTTLTVTAPLAVLISVSLSPDTVVGGSPSTGTVTLDLPASVGGAIIALTSSDPAVQAPATVSVESGQTTATFPATSRPVAADTPVTISAVHEAVTQTATLTVTVSTATLSSIGLSPAAVVGGGPSTGTVTLSGPAPLGGAVVTLSSSDISAAQVPDTTTVAAGQAAATFPVTTSYVTSDIQVTISASYGSVTQTTPLAVAAPTAALTSVSLSPAAVVGGSPSTGTVTLSETAPAGGAVVALTSGNASAAQVPASVTVPGGASTASFTITTSPVAADTPVTISAVYNAVSQSAALTVTVSTATLSSIGLSPETVVGGSPSTGTLILSGPAPLGGALVTLFSSNASAAQVPASVTVPGGASTASFTITTSPVSSNLKAAISAAYRGTNVSTRLTIMAPVLAAHTISPNSVTGGTPSMGTVTLSGPAPAGGVAVTLVSSNTTAVQVPASVTVAAGATTATYSITTSTVTSARTVTISARGGYVTVRADITVTP